MDAVLHKTTPRRPIIKSMYMFSHPYPREIDNPGLYFTFTKLPPVVKSFWPLLKGATVTDAVCHVTCPRCIKPFIYVYYS